MFKQIRNIAILTLVVFGLGYFAAMQSESHHQQQINQQTEVRP